MDAKREKRKVKDIKAVQLSDSKVQEYEEILAKVSLTHLLLLLFNSLESY